MEVGDGMLIQLARHEALINQIIFLDGFGRAGKFLLGKIVSNLERVEFFQYVEVLEHIPILEYLDLIDRSAAISLLQVQLDLSVYNRTLGRNYNLRRSDSSCIYNSTEVDVYMARTLEDNVSRAMAKMKDQNRIPSYLLHNCLPHAGLFFEAYPQAYMINIQRHPIDLAHSWYVNGWGERYGVDPLAFIPVIRGKERPVPWFARDWIQEYVSLGPVGRVVKSICTLVRLEKEGHERLSTVHKDRVLIVPYERFFSAPNEIVSKFSQFLDTVPFSNMNDILKREGCSRDLSLRDRENKLNELKDACKSHHIVEDLILASNKYENEWDIESCI